MCVKCVKCVKCVIEGIYYSYNTFRGINYNYKREYSSISKGTNALSIGTVYSVLLGVYHNTRGLNAKISTTVPRLLLYSSLSWKYLLVEKFHWLGVLAWRVGLAWKAWLDDRSLICV